ncbi:MAG: type II secretion system protein [Planctomycetota bacterium]|nr:type II secretion system protein [Planctomycetota bacterium]
MAQSFMHRSRVRKGAAFTFIEVMMVVVIIGILAAMVIPSFSNVTSSADSSALKGAVAGVRSSIAGYRAKAIMAGNQPYPTLAQLTTQGVVMQGELPVNPYTGLNAVQQVSVSDAASRRVSNAGSYGWNYAFDNSANPPTATFYANSDKPTDVSNGAGGFKKANEL